MHWILPLSDIWIEIIFSYSICCLFILLTASFLCRNFYIYLFSLLFFILFVSYKIIVTCLLHLYLIPGGQALQVSQWSLLGKIWVRLLDESQCWGSLMSTLGSLSATGETLGMERCSSWRIVPAKGGS